MNIEKIVNPESKFETCKYRSNEEIESIIERCSCKGGNYVDKGYFCEKRKIFKFNEGTCNICQEYEHK